MKRIVGWPVFSSRLAAPESTRRMSATLDSTPLSRSNLLFVWRAMICASEVLPVPGGPKNISDWIRSASMARRSNCPGLDRLRLPVKDCRPQSQPDGKGVYNYGSRTLLSIMNRAGNSDLCCKEPGAHSCARHDMTLRLLKGLASKSHCKLKINN